MQAQIRESLIGLVHAPFLAAYPSLALVHDNVAFDRNNPPASWVEYEIKFAGGRPVGMAAAPKTRVHGFVYVTVWSREGTGWKASSQVADWFANQMQYKRAGTVELQAAEPTDLSGPTGWNLDGIKLYFYANPA